MRMSRTWSGVLRMRIDVRMQLMHARLARARGAGDQQVRHGGEVEEHRPAGDVFADGDVERMGGRLGLGATPGCRRELTSWRVWFGTSTPIAERPGMGARIRTSVRRHGVGDVAC